MKYINLYFKQKKNNHSSFFISFDRRIVMKKNVAFEKKIEFPTMIGEISSISLEHTLKFVDESNIEGAFLLTGTYKMTEASRLEENFSYQIPTEIALTEKIDLNTSKLEITDFTYEIENEDVMVCHIELLIEGLEVLEEEKEDRECDGDPVLEKEIEIPAVEKKEEVVEEENISREKNDDEKSFFLNLPDEQDTYGTFVVYIVRQNESLHDIMDKYHTSVEEMEKYNDIHDITIGSKLIIPLLHD